MYRLHCILVIILITAASTLQAQPVDIFPFWQSGYSENYSTGMIWRDCNGDGLIDVFFSNGNDMALAKNTIYINQRGVLPSLPTWHSNNADYSGHCAVGDLDDNGRPDFMVANYLGQGGFGTLDKPDGYYNMTGLPNVVANWQGGTLTNSFSCAFGDVDADGDLDFAVATGDAYYSVSQSDQIYFNNNGSLNTIPGWLSTTTTMAIDVTFGDLDNDGYLDMIFCGDDIGVTAYYNNSGTIPTTPSWQCNNPEAANTVIAGDVDGNGWLDIIVAFNNQLGGEGKFRVYYNDGTGTIDTSPGWQSSTGGYGSALALYDYDDDGDDDLAAGRWWDRPRIYENLGTTFTTTPVWQADNSTVVEEMAWIDIDGDGVEQYSDTIYHSGGHRVFYTMHHPLQEIDSVAVDGSILDLDDYCFDLVSGWVSLATAPSLNIVIYYEYSAKNDLTTANWDTCNCAYANTNAPAVDFSADITDGWAPLSVQFSDDSPFASGWLWQFGDGDSSTLNSPLHTYNIGGAFDVRLQNELPDGSHNRTQHKMIAVLADTVKTPDVNAITNSIITIPVMLTNTQPLDDFLLPISYSGDADLSFVGINTDSCRTDYFDQVQIIHQDSWVKRLTVEFHANMASSNMPLEPGTGPVLNLVLQTTGDMETSNIAFDSYSTYDLECDAGYLVYEPHSPANTVNVYRCGDVNGNETGPNVADVTYLVNYLFVGGPSPNVELVADMNWDGNGSSINVSDVTYLVTYLFSGGPAPTCKPQEW